MKKARLMLRTLALTGTDGQLTDIFTKELGRVKFVEMRQKLGVMALA